MIIKIKKFLSQNLLILTLATIVIAVLTGPPSHHVFVPSSLFNALLKTKSPC